MKWSVKRSVKWSVERSVKCLHGATGGSVAHPSVEEVRKCGEGAKCTIFITAILSSD